MAITKEVLDELLKDCNSPDEFYGPEGLVKQLSKALIERMMQAVLTEQLGYGKNESGEKETENRRNGKTSNKAAAKRLIYLNYSILIIRH